MKMSNTMTAARLAATTLLLAVAAPLPAQSAPTKSAPTKSAPKPKAGAAMDHGMKHDMKHDMEHSMSGEHAGSGWAQLDAYHELMMATWHPAKGKGDLAPMRANAERMSASAKALAASTPPAWCDTPALRNAATDLAPATANVAQLATGQTSDADLKAALASLHTKFEVLEEGCTKPAPRKN